MAKMKSPAAAPYATDDGWRRAESRDKFGFPDPTQTRLISGARSADDEIRREALRQLVLRYEAPLKAFLTAAFKQSLHVTEEWIEDCLAAFKEEKILTAKLTLSYDRAHGTKFRTYLKKCIVYFAIQKFRAENKRREREVHEDTKFSLDNIVASHGNEKPPAGDVEWAFEVLSPALNELEMDCLLKNQEDVLLVFARRYLPPFLGEPSIEALRETAEALKRILRVYASENDVSNTLTTAKRKWKKLTGNILSEYCNSAEEIEEEWNYMVYLLLWASDQEAYELQRQKIKKMFRKYLV